MYDSCIGLRSSTIIVQIVFITIISNLFSRDIWHFLSITQWSSSVSFLYAESNLMWHRKFLTLLLRGILFWLVFTSKQIYFLRINVMGDNLDSFILIFYLLNQVTSKFRWCCRLEGAPTGFPWVAKMAVPSRNVPVVVIGKVGTNMMLVPWGSPDSIGSLFEVSLWTFTSNWL